MSAAPRTLLDKWQLLQAIVCDPALSPAAKAVAARLLHHHNTLTGQCSPSYDTLAQAVGAARSTVINAVSDLQAGGWVSVERVKVPGRTGAQSHVSNRYSFAFDRVSEDQGVVRNTDHPPSTDFGPPPSPKYGPPPSEIQTRGSPKSGPEHGKLEQGKRKKTLSVIEPTAFDRWWSLYPRKVGKEACRPVFDRVLKAGTASLDDLMAGVARYAAERTGEDATYTKHPKTWLNGGHWADEPAPRPDISRGAAPRQWSRPDNAATTLLKRDRMEREAHDQQDPFADPGTNRRPDAGGGPDRQSPSERGRMGGAGQILDLEPIRSDRK